MATLLRTRLFWVKCREKSNGVVGDCGYAMDSALGKSFKDGLGLTGKQIELVEGIASRILHGMNERGRER